jgi:hypothetical protein
VLFYESVILRYRINLVDNILRNFFVSLTSKYDLCTETCDTPCIRSDGWKIRITNRKPHEMQR